MTQHWSKIRPVYLFFRFQVISHPAFCLSVQSGPHPCHCEIVCPSPRLNLPRSPWPPEVTTPWGHRDPGDDTRVTTTGAAPSGRITPAGAEVSLLPSVVQAESARVNLCTFCYNLWKSRTRGQCCFNAVLMLAKCLRRRLNIETTLSQHFIFGRRLRLISTPRGVACVYTDTGICLYITMPTRFPLTPVLSKAREVKCTDSQNIVWW